MVRNNSELYFGWCENLSVLWRVKERSKRLNVLILKRTLNDVRKKKTKQWLSLKIIHGYVFGPDYVFLRLSISIWKHLLNICIFVINLVLIFKMRTRLYLGLFFKIWSTDSFCKRKINTNIRDWRFKYIECMYRKNEISNESINDAVGFIHLFHCRITNGNTKMNFIAKYWLTYWHWEF